MKDSTLLGLTAIICGTIFGCFCVHHNIDHFVAFSIAAGIFGVAGYELKGWWEERKSLK